MATLEEMPDLGGNKFLNDRELERFSSHVIWPAVDYSYENVFIQVASEDEWHKDSRYLQRPDDSPGIIIQLKAGKIANGDGTDYCTAQLSVYRHYPHFTDKAARQGEEGNVWVVTSYEFPDNCQPEIHRRLSFIDRYDEELDEDELSSYLYSLLRASDVFDEDDVYANLTADDCLEIYNSLVVLGIPEHIMRYRDWEYGVD